VDSANAADIVVMTAGFQANNAALVGYRAILGIESACMAAPTEIYAIDIGYIDWQEAGEGDP
jgi:fructose-specific component phosphotransferase system IIB-like protein